MIYWDEKKDLYRNKKKVCGDISNTIKQTVRCCTCSFYKSNTVVGYSISLTPKKQNEERAKKKKKTRRECTTLLRHAIICQLGLLQYTNFLHIGTFILKNNVCWMDILVCFKEDYYSTELSVFLCLRENIYSHIKLYFLNIFCWLSWASKKFSWKRTRP